MRGDVEKAGVSGGGVGKRAEYSMARGERLW